jgi:nicotinamidase/pyrazinamidase
MNPINVRESVLLVVDVQKGFTTLCPQELPVPGGLEIVPTINKLLGLDWARIDASQDWHPPDHCSFLGQSDNLYPPHCVMNTPDAEFVPGLDSHLFRTIWRKGYVRTFEAYAVTSQHPSMFDLYRGGRMRNIVVCGIATNICCYYAARDLKEVGFRVQIVEDASAGIDVPAASLFQAKTREEGQALGIEYVNSATLL